MKKIICGICAFVAMGISSAAHAAFDLNGLCHHRQNRPVASSRIAQIAERYYRKVGIRPVLIDPDEITYGKMSYSDMARNGETPAGAEGEVLVDPRPIRKEFPSGCGYARVGYRVVVYRFCGNYYVATAWKHVPIPVAKAVVPVDVSVPDVEITNVPVKAPAPVAMPAPILMQATRLFTTSQASGVNSYATLSQATLYYVPPVQSSSITIVNKVTGGSSFATASGVGGQTTVNNQNNNNLNQSQGQNQGQGQQLTGGTTTVSDQGNGTAVNPPGQSYPGAGAGTNQNPPHPIGTGGSYEGPVTQNH